MTMTIPEAARLWQLPPRTVRMACEAHGIDGAARFGLSWLIPANARRPGQTEQEAISGICSRKRNSQPDNRKEF